MSSTTDDVRYKVERAAIDIAHREPVGGTIRLPVEWWPVFYDKYRAQFPRWVQRKEPPRGQTFRGRKIYWVPK